MIEEAIAMVRVLCSNLYLLKFLVPSRKFITFLALFCFHVSLSGRSLLHCLNSITCLVYAGSSLCILVSTVPYSSALAQTPSAANVTHTVQGTTCLVTVSWTLSPSRCKQFIVSCVEAALEQVCVVHGVL